MNAGAQRMQMATEDGQRLFKDCQQITQKIPEHCVVESRPRAPDAKSTPRKAMTALPNQLPLFEGLFQVCYVVLGLDAGMRTLAEKHKQ
jgi:hypothetical protein